MKKNKDQKLSDRKHRLGLLSVAASWLKFKKPKSKSGILETSALIDPAMQAKCPLLSSKKKGDEFVSCTMQNESNSSDIPINSLCDPDNERPSISLQQGSQFRASILISLRQASRTITEIIEQMGVEDGPVYLMSSWFLHDCYRFLVQKEVESMHYVTGLQMGNVFTLDRMVTFHMSHQSVISARGDIRATHRVLIEIDRYGHGLHAYFHSHPGNGELTIRPSSVDLDYQARLEKGGYAAIGGIFSRDGYFRAYSLNNPFTVVIYGKGVAKINDRTYRLIEVN
jgi:hypothetical protein